MLEDESGRIRLVGEYLTKARLVTGVIVGALGMETPNGDFEVVDMCSADLASQLSAVGDSEQMNVDSKLHPIPWWMLLTCARLIIRRLGRAHLWSGGRLGGFLRCTYTDAHRVPYR